ncbi:MAG: pyridoxamine 5'-phosphate oxidase family protein [Acidimicrobiia bacterium]|jgi:nitroimidazol reductase NimA-like FMN-containing flavoprotein (pyridoxamine 5'-phosphate oxidase superfamily)|nr:pyridoxamine 5'-phosphate oxidase family protein [Acidimicrobiia bacterium]MBP8180521.1 pyridoxamine 5'-phosphate oxidase family protein [Acidimicrobiia bacterium]
MNSGRQNEVPPSDRVRLRRLPKRGSYQRDTIYSILDTGLVAHVAGNAPDGPIALPMAYGRIGDTLYVHGAARNSLLTALAGQDCCLTVTHVDGLVMARSAFHHSMNYRSVVVRGATRVVDGDEKTEGLKAIVNHVAPRWDGSRPPTPTEMELTTVLALELTECSAKVRTGDPRDEASDMTGPWWAGVIPVTTVFGEPEDASDLPPGRPVPTALRSLANRSLA